MVQSHIQPNPCHPLTILYNAKHCCHQRFLLYSSIHFGGLARRGWLVTTMWANRSLDSATSIYWNRSGVVLRKRSKFSMVHMLRNTCRQSGLCCQRGNQNILDKCSRLDLGHGNRSHTVYNRKNTWESKNRPKTSIYWMLGRKRIVQLVHQTSDSFSVFGFLGYFLWMLRHSLFLQRSIIIVFRVKSDIFSMLRLINKIDLDKRQWNLNSKI